MGITIKIVDIATTSIPAHLTGARIRSVKLNVGKLSAVVADSLWFCFEVAARDTALEGAHLHISEIPIRARCNSCRSEWTIDSPDFTCPSCPGRRRSGAV